MSVGTLYLRTFRHAGARLAAAALLAFLTLAAGSAAVWAQPESAPVIRIGSKNFTEQLLLGEIYALLLEEHGYRVERRLNLAGTLVAHQALVHGEIDLYPEYTGTGLFNMLNLEPMSDAEAVYNAVKQGYEENWDLIWLDPAPMNNTQAIAVTRATAEKYDMYTLSRMAEVAPELVMAAVPEFTERPDGLKGLQEVYGGFEFRAVRLVDFGIKYRVLLQGQADVTVAFGTDGEIIGHDLVVMEDDKGLWPPYQVAPVVRKELLERAPEIADILNSVQPYLTDETAQRLNREVDGNRREYTRVAREFLQEIGLIR